MRNELKELTVKTNGVPIVLTGKYKHNPHSIYATFTTVRPYIPNIKTSTVCDHVNFLRSEIEKWVMLNEEFHNRKFYFIGTPKTYCHYGVERYGIDLLKDGENAPIFFNTDKDEIDISRFYSFNADDYGRK